MEDKRDVVNWPDHKTLPPGEQGTLCVTGPNQVTINILSALKLHKLHNGV